MAQSLEAIIDKEPEQQDLVEDPIETPPEEVKAVEETTEPEEAKVEETTEEVVEDTGEEEDTTPPVVETKEVPLTALLDERDKRKEAKAEAERLSKELEEVKRQPLDFYEDPEGAISAKIQEAIKPLQEEIVETREENVRNFIDYSRQMTKEFVGEDKYEPAEKAFAEAAKQNPLLVQNALESGNPGKYMYDTGTQMLQLDSAGGDVNAMREQIRAELKAEMMAEAKQKEDKLEEVPESLTETPSAMAPVEKVATGPTPLENILPSN